MRALLGLSDDRSCDCAGIDRIANEHLRRVDRKIADLTALRRELKAVIDSCEGGTVAQCRIIEALGSSVSACLRTERLLRPRRHAPDTNALNGRKVSRQNPRSGMSKMSAALATALAVIAGAALDQLTSLQTRA